MSEYFTDMSAYLNIKQAETVAKNSTNKKAGSDLELNDFLKLMVAMFQNQSIDDNVSTSEMMNQMVQMSVIQAVNNINSMMSESTGLNYAASLVGKEVTIGTTQNGSPAQVRGVVTGTGTLQGEQVIFIGDEKYSLSSVIAVGRIPEGAASEAVKVDNKAEAENRAQEKLDEYAVSKLADTYDISDAQAKAILSAWNKYWDRENVSANELSLLTSYGLYGLGELYDRLDAGATLSENEMQALQRVSSNGLGLITRERPPLTTATEEAAND